MIFVWLGREARSASPAQIVGQLEKLAFLRELGAPGWQLETVSANRRRQLAAGSCRRAPDLPCAQQRGRQPSERPGRIGGMVTAQQRRGARHPSLVPAEVLTLLESGQPSANHMEQIAMDMGNLLTWQFPLLSARAGELRDKGLVMRMRSGGQVMLEELGPGALVEAPSWSSDTARGWAAMAIGQTPGLPLEELLSRMRPFADDPHFAVREWAWLSARAAVARDLKAAIEELSAWAREPSERLRRFASEATRPRGVWSSHLPQLKTQPALGLPVLEPLRADPARYVQDSVANWLNDAAKSCPDWVRSVCRRWTVESLVPATERICRRALRSL